MGPCLVRKMKSVPLETLMKAISFVCDGMAHNCVKLTASQRWTSIVVCWIGLSRNLAPSRHTWKSTGDTHWEIDGLALKCLIGSAPVRLNSPPVARSHSSGLCLVETPQRRQLSVA